MERSRNRTENESRRDKNYSFINHAKCEAFPCHGSVGEAEFNCLFCYCPLYFLDENCVGSFTYTDKGVKDCSNCIYPHKKENYSRVVEKLTEAIQDRRII